MSLSRFRSNTDLVCIALAAGALAASVVGCSSPSCGTSGASATGLTADVAGITLTFGTLTASANNDCPATGAPAGVVSLTINGSQVGGTGLVTFCIGRPDLIEQTSQALGTGVQVVDMTADNGSCTFAIDHTATPTGTVHTAGMCDNGTNKAGFELVIDGALSLKRTCGTTVDSVAAALSGSVAVAM